MIKGLFASIIFPKDSEESKLNCTSPPIEKLHTKRQKVCKVHYRIGIFENMLSKKECSTRNVFASEAFCATFVKLYPEPQDKLFVVMPESGKSCS